MSEMQLLVSVKDVEEATAALAGGADFIDAKDPAAGALGAVSLDVLRDIHSSVAGLKPVSAALGDAIDERSIERDARAYALAGASLVKIGFAGISSRSRVDALLNAAKLCRRTACGSDRRGLRRCGTGREPTPGRHSDAAANVSVAGVLLDTADKRGPGLSQHMPLERLASWVTTAHRAGLLVAIAGKLAADDIAFARETGADIAGVRGAACDDGRTGRVVADKVRLLRSRMTADALACR